MRGLGTRASAVALIFSGAGLLLAWVPFAGLVLASAGVAISLRAPSQRFTSTSRVVGGFAVVLGLGFTVAYSACTPSFETPTELRQWEEFDQAFEADVVPSQGGSETPSPQP